MGRTRTLPEFLLQRKRGRKASFYQGIADGAVNDYGHLPVPYHADRKNRWRRLR